MQTAPDRHPVTIVVPVYGDLPSLIACVESLQRTVDQSVDRVLLMNDCGPDADEIESVLLAMIAEDEAFSYERNPSNLGFVGNCNRAALEVDTTGNDILLLNSDTVTTAGFVDELSAVLYAAPDHGAVCPRSNNATIASLPYKRRDPSLPRTFDRSLDLHAALKDDLPRYSVAPVAMGFCILIRRTLIDRFGLFDPIFSPGYGEENDFCLRIRAHGHLSVIAHRALVLHAGSRSFAGARREALRYSHEQIVVKRYPHYAAAVRRYVHVGRDVVDVLADALLPDDDETRVYVDLGTGVDLALVRAAEAVARTGARVTVAAHPRHRRRLARAHPALTFVRTDQSDVLADVALARTPFEPAVGARLNRTSPRWLLVGGADPLADETLTAERLSEAPAAVGRLRGATVAIPSLRGRWDAITARPGYVQHTAPTEPLPNRVYRKLLRVSPRLFGLARAILRRMRRSRVL
jgi:GT2 family glycosyltransferase